MVSELKNFNDLAESNPSALNEKFYQEYGWTVNDSNYFYQYKFKGVQINLLDNALKHVAAKFRLRGLNHFSN